MTKRDDGGRAFPLAGSEASRYGEAFNYPEYGMSLRDYFAGQALAPACAHVYASYAAAPRPIDNVAELVAALTYEMADAMLAERAKP